MKPSSGRIVLYVSPDHGVCATCGGSGKRAVAYCEGHDATKVPCGITKEMDYPCPNCNGSGFENLVIRPAVIIAPCLERFPGSDYRREECQLNVFWDGENDDPTRGTFRPAKTDGSPDFSAPRAWRTSVPHDENKAPGTWHWPPRV